MSQTHQCPSRIHHDDPQEILDNVRLEHTDVGKIQLKKTHNFDNFIYSTILLRHVTVQITEITREHISNKNINNVHSARSNFAHNKLSEEVVNRKHTLILDRNHLQYNITEDFWHL